jgi:hypothetical protein
MEIGIRELPDYSPILRPINLPNSGKSKSQVTLKLENTEVTSSAFVD